MSALAKLLQFPEHTKVLSGPAWSVGAHGPRPDTYHGVLYDGQEVIRKYPDELTLSHAYLAEVPKQSSASPSILNYLIDCYKQMISEAQESILLSDPDERGNRYIWLPGTNLHKKEDVEGADRPIRSFLESADESGIDSRGLHMLGFKSNLTDSSILENIFTQLHRGLRGELATGAKPAFASTGFDEVTEEDLQQEPSALFSRLA